MEILIFIANFFREFAFTPEFQLYFFFTCFLLLNASIIMFICERFGK